jgi:phosphoglucomutase
MHRLCVCYTRQQITYSIIVAGDGRYFNTEAMQIICRVLAANGVADIWIPATGIMSTPAVSAAIRMRKDGQCLGSIILTASHNPGGPGEDFGIKYNLAYGQPAGEDFTDDVSHSMSQECVLVCAVCGLTRNVRRFSSPSHHRAALRKKPDHQLVQDTR